MEINIKKLDLNLIVPCKTKTKTNIYKGIGKTKIPTEIEKKIMNFLKIKCHVCKCIINKFDYIHQSKFNFCSTSCFHFI